MRWIRRRRADTPNQAAEIDSGETDTAGIDRGVGAPGNALATAGDILACFRLLLGRAPGQEEMRGHMRHVGSPLADVVAGYLSSQEFKARRLASAEMGGWRLVSTMPGFSLFVSQEDAAVGAAIAASGTYEPHVTAVFERHLRPGLRVIDVGANIGWFTMLAGLRVGSGGHVLAVEPNPLNARMIEASRRANAFDHVSMLPAAAGSRNGAVSLNRTYSNASVSPLERINVLEAEIVPMIRLDDVIGDDWRPVGLVKIDVEGAEAIALGGLERVLRRDRPVIVSELCPNMMPGNSGVTGTDYLEWLRNLDYGIGVIEPDGSVTACATAEQAIEAHVRSGVDHIDLLLEPR